MMKVVEITKFGGPEVLCLVQRPVPVPGIGELLIRVSASGINRPDVLQRMGHYPVPAGVTDIPGLEVAGVIEQGDPVELELAGFKLGDRVCALVAGGDLAAMVFVLVAIATTGGSVLAASSAAKSACADLNASFSSPTVKIF